MPPMYEGDLLYMPTTLPGLSVDEAANILANHGPSDPGNAGGRASVRQGRARRDGDRSGAAFDAGNHNYVEAARAVAQGESVEQLIHKLDEQVRLPGLTNSWGYPIRTRIDMLSTGISTPFGIKVTGPDLSGIAELAEKIEAGSRPCLVHAQYSPNA